MSDMLSNAYICVVCVFSFSPFLESVLPAYVCKYSSWNRWHDNNGNLTRRQVAQLENLHIQKGSAGCTTHVSV